MQRFVFIGILIALGLLGACAEIEPQPLAPSPIHIGTEPEPTRDIPDPVVPIPTVPEPTPPLWLERYTVVVNEVPVKELLFALARDAGVNVDIDPTVEGVVILNAIDQTLPQILDRIVRQVGVRYEFEGDNLYVQPDRPFLKTYTIDYVNLSRDMQSSNSVATQVASVSGEGSGGNYSKTDVNIISSHRLWESLTSGIAAILGSAVGDGEGTTVVASPESGVVIVNATATQHEVVQAFIDQVLRRAKRQVLIQATIIEVTLNDQYQAGVAWELVNAGGSGIEFTSPSSADIQQTAEGGTGVYTLTATGESLLGDHSLTATISLLDRFGETKVLSSPQLMTLNNQTAMLKVVDNVVYFEVTSDTVAGGLGNDPLVTIETDPRVVPVGIIMTMTPQIDDDDVITLNVRPTISRLVAFVNDPNPELAKEDVKNPVPRIAVNEMDSILRLVNGQIGVLGGLMTDDQRDDDAGIPGLKDVSFFGNLFKSKSKSYTKKELVIFLRPTIVKSPSLDGDLNAYRRYLDSVSDTSSLQTTEQ